MPDFIDYSAYAAWMFCPWKYYEQYVLKRRKRWPEGLREDALAVGSLAHAGLENHYANNNQEIPQGVIDKICPTSEALGLCRRLVYGYVNHFPREAWELIRCEQPLRFDLIEGKNGLAKLDLYFYISEPTVVESGIAGYEITLKPGWWIQEYKTKSAATSFADFMHEWTTKMQADFQMLALQHYIQNNPPERGHEGSCNPEAGCDGLCMDFAAWAELANQPVNGLLVNVIEKPKEYVPRRKCPSCKTTWNFTAWQPGEGGKHACPQCGQQKKLDPVDGEKFQEASYFRMVVERTPEQLATSYKQIACIARLMQQMEEGPFENADFPPNKEHCFDNSRRWGKECDFYVPHTYNISTIDNPKYEATEDYLGEVPPSL